jgi:hypothetical protein
LNSNEKLLFFKQITIVMPPRFTVGCCSSPYINEKSMPNNSSYKRSSTNAINREFEISRADARSRAAGALGLGGRVFVSVSAGKGNSIHTYI